MNICLVTASFWPGWGGAERQCQLLARTLTQLGHNVVVLTRGVRDLAADDGIEGVAVRRTAVLGTGTLRSLVWTLTATAWLRRHARQFQVIQCYQLMSPAHVGILGRSAGQAVLVRPACSGVDGDVAEIQRLPLTWVRRRLLRTVDAFVTLTGAIERELAEFGLGTIPCHRIPNGVDLTAFSPATNGERRELRVRLGLPEDRVLCAFAGRLTPQKDPHLLLSAWAMGRFSGAHLVLVGDGPLRRGLEARCASGPLAGWVTVAGATAQIAPYLRAADLFVLPSRAEGMSNVMLEAMACGLPIVATDVDGNREVVGADGVSGRLVPSGDPAAMAEAIGKLVGMPALRQELGSAARAMVQERFDIRRITARYLSLYEELM